MINTLPSSLLEELKNPLVGIWSPQYLAFRTVNRAMGCVGKESITTIGQPVVTNDWKPDGPLVNVGSLRYLAEQAHTGEDLLLNILEGGRASTNRHMLAYALNLSNATLGADPSTSKDTLEGSTAAAMNSHGANSSTAKDQAGAGASVSTNPSRTNSSLSTGPSPAVNYVPMAPSPTGDDALIVITPPGTNASVSTNPSEANEPTTANCSGSDTSVAANSSEPTVVMTMGSSASDSSRATASSGAENLGPLAPDSSPNKSPRGSPNYETRSWAASAALGGCSDVVEIPIPAVIKISRHVEPYFSQLQDTYMIWLKINKDRRVLICRSQEERRLQLDQMILDRHLQEFRSTFLSYVLNCIEMDQSRDFKAYHRKKYIRETRRQHELADGVATTLNENYAKE
ncbi:hypothetical protein O1611_g6554 [Lasiodiplodia mahajangana]|uniref:Uncharacterized protein n=1 Tax=Lasiodiplodia mahajangana TaxID=1108764 RepID=A0ACC2JHW3_9PEZI|nr:hypothetical protein O1611_g6554 [Lasiodiplodia mahajangana]